MAPLALVGIVLSIVGYTLLGARTGSSAQGLKGSFLGKARARSQPGPADKPVD